MTIGETRFCEVYREEIQTVRLERPADYPWPLTSSLEDKMCRAFVARSYNKDSEAIKRTCKRLNIPHTYKAINAYLLKKGGPI